MLVVLMTRPSKISFSNISFQVSKTIIYSIFTSGDRKVANTMVQDSTIAHVIIDDIVFHAEEFGNDTARTTIIHGVQPRLSVL